MYRKKIEKSVCLACLSFIVLLSLISFAKADSFAPAWLKEGSYVKYTLNEAGYILTVNNTNPLDPGQVNYANATYGWQCIYMNDTVAKLKVTVDCVATKIDGAIVGNVSKTFTGEVYVNLLDRSVSNADGKDFGITHVWLPSNPSQDEKIVVYDNVTLTAETKNMQVSTPQGVRDGFLVAGTGTTNGAPINFNIFCEYSTGLMVDGMFTNDPVLTAIGIRDFLVNGQVIFSDSNINFGDASSTFDWMLIAQFTILPVALVVLFVAFYRRIRKKTK